MIVINTTKSFRQNIKSNETYGIAKDLLKNELEKCSSEESNDLIIEEIEKLDSKFSQSNDNEPTLPDAKKIG